MPNTQKAPVKVALPLIALLAALAPLSIDTYLPAIKQISQELSQPIHLIEQSITLFMIGYAIGMFIGGVVSDYRGRKTTIYIGLSIFIVASLLLATAESLMALNGYRLLQAVGGSMATVVGPAIIRDTHHGPEMAKAFAFIGLIMLMAPLLAPALGTGILWLSHWEMIFIFLAAYGALLLVIYYFLIPETLATGKSRIQLATVIQRYKSVLSQSHARPFLYSMPLAFGCMFIFVTESAFIYLKHFQQSEDVFPLLFAANIITMLFFNRLGAYLLRFYSSVQLVKAGLAVQFIGSCALLAHSLLAKDSLWLYLPAVMLAVGSLGLTVPNIISSYLSFFTENSTIANSFLSTLQFAGGGFLGFVATLLHNSQLSTIAGLMLVCSVVATLNLWLRPNKALSPNL